MLLTYKIFTVCIIESNALLDTVPSDPNKMLNFYKAVMDNCLFSTCLRSSLEVILLHISPGFIITYLDDIFNLVGVHTVSQNVNKIFSQR